MNREEIERLSKEKFGEEVTPLAWLMLEFAESQGHLQEALDYIFGDNAKQG